MPSYAISSPLSPLPSVSDTSGLQQLLMQQGQQRANAALQSGQIWGNAIQGIGNAVAGGVQAYQENKAMSRQAQAVNALFDDPNAKPEDFIRVLGPDKGLKVVQGLKALHPDTPYEDQMMRVRDAARAIKALPEESRSAAYAQSRQQLITLGHVDPSLVSEQYDPRGIDYAANYGEKGGPEAGFTLTPGQTRFDASGKQIASLEAKPEPTKVGTHVVGGNLVDDTGKVIFRAPERPEGAGKGTWVNRGGQPVFVSESQIQPGDTPYESARQAVKKLPAGTAEDFGNFKTSLDELENAKTTLSVPGGTGAVAKAETMLPGFVTQATGLGTEAKQRQAVIDRVKQIIGKTLEGGVLRKEDEAKYEKILPTIGDPPAVAAAKIEGLKKTMNQRFNRQLDAQEDAGYDVAGFRAREAKAVADDDPLGLFK